VAGVFLKVKSLYESLSDAQKAIADCILDTAGGAPPMSIHELADNAGVSAATVSRFARELGYENFKEFNRQMLQQTVAEFREVFEPVNPDDSDSDAVEKVFAGNVQSLKDTLAMLEVDALIRAADAIAEASHLLAVGIGSSGNLADDLALRLTQLRIPAIGCTDAYRVLHQTTYADEGSVVIGISHSGRSRITVDAVRRAKENGATTVAISNYMKSPIHDLSDIFLCTSFPESHVEVAALSSRVAQTCIIDALYLLVARRRKANMAEVGELNEAVEDVLHKPTH
jgi:DNA-binding MurR/RpiR family transcriptional regulator